MSNIQVIFKINIFLILVVIVNCANILFIAPQGSKSHKNFYFPIISALAEHGHKITFLTPYESKQKTENIEEILYPENSVDKYELDIFKHGIIKMSMKNMELLPKLCVDSLKSEKSQRLYNNTYDLIFMSPIGCECYLALVHHFKVPTIVTYPVAITNVMAERMGLPFFPSFIPNIFFGSSNLPLSFSQRLGGTLFDLLITAISDHVTTKKIEQLCHEEGVCPSDMPSFHELNYNVSLVITNSVRSLENPSRPNIPTIIHAGGIHCKPHQPLNKELDDWISGAGEHGCILFSLGSIMKPKLLPTEHRDVFIEVFRNLKQRVIWKWDEPIDDLPKNVKVMKWLPQQDIIGDSRVRLFMSHGGLLSSQEAFYHGVPIIGFPLFGDQTSNMKEIERIGVGKKIDWTELTIEKLNDTIHGILNNQKMTELVKLRSKIMKDQPLSSKEEVVYWTEYLLRYNGAPHLQSPVRQMTWIQLYNIDVWTFVVLVTLTSIFISLKLFICCVRCCCCNKRKPKLKSQ